MLPRGGFNMTATNLSLAGNRFARFACPATEMRMKAIHKHLHWISSIELKLSISISIRRRSGDSDLIDSIIDHSRDEHW